MKFAGFYEEIEIRPEIRVKYPRMCHRQYHIFGVEITSGQTAPPDHPDHRMEGTEWVEVSRLPELPEVYPAELRILVENILQDGAPMYFGTRYTNK